MSQRLVYGGSFNPVHLGHLQIAAAASALYGQSPVTFIPNYQNPLKELGLSKEHRLAMLELVLGEPDNICLFEIEQDSLSYTVDTLQYLKSQSDESLVFLLGADCLESLHLWKDVVRLFDLATMQLVTRPGHELKLTKKLKELLPEEVLNKMLEDVLTLEIPYSSSTIREQIKEGHKPDGLDTKLWSYIKENDLYL